MKPDNVKVIAIQLERINSDFITNQQLYTVLANGIIMKGIDSVIRDYEEKYNKNKGSAQTYFHSILKLLKKWDRRYHRT